MIAVERFPVRRLLSDAGISDAGISDAGDLSTFSGIKKPANKIAELRNARREKERGGQGRSRTNVLAGSDFPDDKTVRFSLRTEVEVQKPDLLLEQMGSAELIRFTLAKGVIKDDQLYVFYGSALKKWWDEGDEAALQKALDSCSPL